MPRDLLTRVNWDLIYPAFRDRCFELVARCRARGADYFATSGCRTPEEQLKLWQQGRDAKGSVVDPKRVVTKVKFGAHNAGVAVDFTRDSDTTRGGLQPSWKAADYQVLATEAKALGLEAGYFWKSFPDAPHVQLPLSTRGVTLSQLRAEYQKGGMPAVWKLLDDKGFGV